MSSLFKFFFTLCAVPSLLAATFGTWTAPLLTGPLLAYLVLYGVFRFTPSSQRLLGTTFHAPTWSPVLRIIALVGFGAALVYASYVGVVGVAV